MCLKLELGKSYTTKGGLRAVVIMEGFITLAGETDCVVCCMYQKDGRNVVLVVKKDGTHNLPLYNLVSEWDPYAEFKIDDPVVVWDKDWKNTIRGYFAGVSGVTNKPSTWASGKTKWSANDSSDIHTWDFCVKADEYDYKKYGHKET